MFICLQILKHYIVYAIAGSFSFVPSSSTESRGVSNFVSAMTASQEWGRRGRVRREEGMEGEEGGGEGG